MQRQPKDPLVYIIAGEPSGDLLGARLMESLKRQTGGRIRFAGLGGDRMQQEGLKSLFPISELSIMGFAELVPHIPKLMGRMNQTINDILLKNPDIVITIDSPGFNFRIAKKLREITGNNIKLVHYVAPTVWAYKPQRALKISKLFDHLMVLLPFEPPYFEAVGLPCTFVGHPITWEWRNLGDGAAFRARHGIAPDAPVLIMLPGSRKGEISRHMPVFTRTAKILAKRFPGLTVVMAVSHHIAEQVKDKVSHWPMRTIMVVGDEEKKDAFAAGTLALAKSGTVTLELAMAKVPMVVTYKVSPISAFMMRMMSDIKYVSLVNIVLDKPIIPELIQEHCTPAELADALTHLLTSEEAQTKQISEAAEALAELGYGTPACPSDQTAELVLSLMPKHPAPDGRHLQVVNS